MRGQLDHTFTITQLLESITWFMTVPAAVDDIWVSFVQVYVDKSPEVDHVQVIVAAFWTRHSQLQCVEVSLDSL